MCLHYPYVFVSILTKCILHTNYRGKILQPARDKGMLWVSKTVRQFVTDERGSLMPPAEEVHVLYDLATANIDGRKVPDGVGEETPCIYSFVYQ